MVLRSCLKALGSFLAVLLIFGLILGGVGYFAIRNFDLNMFRTEIEKRLAQQTGFRVELGNIKFQWNPLPQFQVASLKFYLPQSAEKILQSDQVRVDTDLASIWQKRFVLSRVTIQGPEIFLRRNKDGGWNWHIPKDLRASAAGTAPMLSEASLIPTAEASEGAESIPLSQLNRVTEGWSIGLEKIFIRDGTIHFVDETVDPIYKVDIEKFDAEVRHASSQEVYHLTAGGMVFNSAKKNLDVVGDLDLALKSLDFLLHYGPEKVTFKGRLNVVNDVPQFAGSLEVHDLDMGSVIPASYRKGSFVTGRLSARTQISFSGANPIMIKKSLKGQGTVEILDGAFKNRNFIKEVFDRLSPVLAVTSALGGELPPEVAGMLNGPDMPFQSLHVVCSVQEGVVRVDEFGLAHSSYNLSGQGTYGLLEGQVEGVMVLLLSKGISAYLIDKIHELELVADQKGQVTIPFRCGGVFPNVSVQPDLSYVGARLLQRGTDQLLNRGFEQLSKFLERKRKK